MRAIPLRLFRPATCAAVALALAACAPRQDPLHNDEAPDLNYAITALKDAKHQGSIAPVDQEVMSRMQGVLPGCALAVVQGGQIRYLRGYGVADFQVAANPNDDVPFTKRSVCGIGSVSKVLTSIAVMKLVEQGKVALDAPVAGYFPHWTPGGWSQITVRQLLSHRAGLPRDPDAGQAGFLPPAFLDQYFGFRCSQHPRFGVLEFILTDNAAPQPGQIGDYLYSNLGYAMLGAIVDWVTQLPAFGDGQRGYERFVWSLVAGADDAALTACLQHHWRTGDIPDEVQGYTANWQETTPVYSGWHGPAGGWSMTIGDLGRVLLALMGNQVLAPASLQAMRVDPGMPGNGSGYGLGLFVSDKASRPAFHHGGSIGGYRTQVIVWPNHDVAVAVFGNADRNGVGGIAEAVGRLWIEQGPFVPQLDWQEAAFVGSAEYQVSVRDVDGAEECVGGLRGRLGEAGAAAALRGVVGGQGAAGAALADLVTRDPSRREDACGLFLQMLARDGHLGGYVRR